MGGAGSVGGGGGSGGSPAGALLWQRHFGGSEDDAILDVSVDATDDVYAAGRFRASVTFDTATVSSAGQDDGFVARFGSTSGTAMWAAGFGGVDDDDAPALRTSATTLEVGFNYDGGQTVSTFDLVDTTSGRALIELDPATGAVGLAVAVPPTEIANFSLHSVIPERVLVGFRGLHAMSATGVDQTFETGTGVYPPRVLAATTLANGDYLIAGAFESVQNPATLFGETIELPFPGSQIPYLARLSSAFDVIWIRPFGVPGSAINDPVKQHVVGLAERSDGTLLAVGTMWFSFDAGAGMLDLAGGTDIFVMEVTSEGVPMGGRSFGGPMLDRVQGVALRDGVLAIAGTADGTMQVGPVTEGTDALVMTLDAQSLEPRWLKHSAGDTGQVATAVAIDSLGNVTVGGYFEGTIDFGEPLTSSGGEDAFLVRFAP